MSDLPDGWEWATLEELGYWYGGGTPSKFNPSYWEGGEIPWVSPKDMSSIAISDTTDHITELALESSVTRVVPAGAVIFVTRSGILSRKLPVATLEIDATLNQDMKAIYSKPGVDSYWLAYLLQSKESEILQEYSKAGTTVASLDVARLAKMPVPLPPLAEQHRIVDALEDHLSRVESGLYSLKCVASRLADEYHRYLAQVTNIFTNDGALPAEWGTATVGELARVGTGMTPSKSEPLYYEGGEVPWITSSALNKPVISDSESHVTSHALSDTSLKMYPEGTLLVAMYGEGKTRGKCSELAFPATINQACAAINVQGEHIERAPWIKLVLEASYELNRRSSSGGVQPNLNLTAVRNIRLPLPPIRDQGKILRSVDRFRVNNAKIVEIIGRCKVYARDLHQSLLREAFAGRLVSQDPDDEPASVLLERIRAERESASKTKVARKKRTAKSRTSETQQHDKNIDPSTSPPEAPDKGTQDALELDL